MNKLDEKIVHATLTHDVEGMWEVLQEISWKIGKGMGTVSEISRPLYVVILQQYADALIADMGEAECEFTEGLIEMLNKNSTCIKIQVPSKEE